MRSLVTYIIILFTSFSLANAADIFDMEGNRIYYSEESGKTHQVKMPSGGMATQHELRLIHQATGQAYEYDSKWEEVYSAGIAIATYNYNKRKWGWVANKGLKPCKDKTGLIVNCSGLFKESDRIYAVENHVYTVSEQGDYPILTYKDRTYFNEFGEPVFTHKGDYFYWQIIVLLDYYYKKNYNTEAMPKILERREAAAKVALDSNSIARDMLALGQRTNRYERTFMGKPLQMVYFTMINDKVMYLSEEHVLRLKNKWLVINEETYRRSNPHHMPAGGFYVSKRNAKKRGLQYTKSHFIVIEVKAKSDFTADFQTALFE